MTAGLLASASVGQRQVFRAVVALIAALHACAGPAATPDGIRERRVLVIMARFPGVEPSVPVEEMRTKYFDKLDRYLRAVSLGRERITGKLTRWHTLPEPVARYSISQHNLAVDKSRVTQLIQDAIDLADEDEEFSRYDMLFISLGVERAAYGMMGLCGYPGMLGWRSEAPIITKRKRQAIPGGVAIYCERAHVGVVFHDMAHILGGVRDGRRVMPCLYDHDLQGRPGPFRGFAQFYLIHLGYFDPMSCHMFQPDIGPPGVCAWTALRLNWLPPKQVVEVARGETRTLLLGPLRDGSSEILAVRIPTGGTTYYLIENRQPIGPDRNLPSHGVLISRCDDAIAECRGGKSPVSLINADPSIPELRAAPFTPQGRNTFEDRKRNIAITLLAQKGMACEIRVARGR